MKRYLLFYGRVYYPEGGMDDFEGDFDTVHEALSKLKTFSDENDWGIWGHIFDTETKKIFYRIEP